MYYEKIAARLNATKTADNPTAGRSAVVQPDSDKHICLQRVAASGSAVRYDNEILDY